MQALAISGSLRGASFNTALLRTAAEIAPDDMSVTLFEGLERIPHYNADLDTEDALPEVARLRREVTEADAVLIATPEFNGTVPGALKDAIDWLSRPYGQGSALFGKPVAVIGASVTAYGAVWAQDHLRKALGIAGARVVETELAVAQAAERFDDDGKLVDEETRGQLAELLAELTGAGEALQAAA